MTARRNAGLASATLLSISFAAVGTVSAPLPAHADGDAGRMVLVLDSSGSMKDPAQGGMTKIDAAKKSLTGVIQNLPVDAQVGLRVFGATVENRGTCCNHFK